MSNTNFFSEKEPIDTSKQNDIVIPVIEETVTVGKKLVETATLKVTSN